MPYSFVIYQWLSIGFAIMGHMRRAGREHDHNARCSHSRALCDRIVADLLERLHSLDARHLIACLIAHIDQRVNVPGAFARAQYLSLREIVCFDVRTLESIAD